MRRFTGRGGLRFLQRIAGCGRRVNDSRGEEFTMAIKGRRMASEARPQLGRLKIRSVRDGETQLITLVGKLDVAGATEVERELRRVERSEPTVIVIDLRELTFIDSTGIALIVDANQRSAHIGHRLIVVSANPRVQRAFETCGEDLPLVATLPSDAAGGSVAIAARRVGPSARRRHSRRTATRRRIDEAALAAAVRELRTRRRPGVRR
jgi:anti-anti-sigma factor